MASRRRYEYGERELEERIARYFEALENGRLMRQAATQLRAHLETSPAWAGSNGSKAVFLIKQQLWDGQAYADKRETGGGPAAIQVTFGPGRQSGDAFG